MGNGMYCEAEIYYNDVTEEERLYSESRRILANLKSGHRRLVLLVKQLHHFKRNPLGAPMCKKIETQIYQQTLILKRQQGDLRRMVDEYNRQNEDADSTQSPSQHSSQDDWQEVIEMAKKPIEFVLSRSNSSSSSHSGSSSGGSTANNGSSSRDEVFKSVYYSSSPSSSTATTISSSGENVPVKSRKAYTQQMTPPIEEIIEFREKLREIERSPLFMATPPTKRGQIGALFSSSQNTPLSLP